MLAKMPPLKNITQNKCCRWTYDADGKLLDTNCEDFILHTIFYNHDSFSYIMDYAQDHENPLILSRPIAVSYTHLDVYKRQASIFSTTA